MKNRIAKTIYIHKLHYIIHISNINFEKIKKAEKVSEKLPVQKDLGRADMTLLPCPCCGSKEIYYFWYKHACGKNRVGILCGECMLQMDTGTDALAFQVRQRWNRRAKQNE